MAGITEWHSIPKGHCLVAFGLWQNLVNAHCRMNDLINAAAMIEGPEVVVVRIRIHDSILPHCQEKRGPLITTVNYVKQIEGYLYRLC